LLSLSHTHLRAEPIWASVPTHRKRLPPCLPNRSVLPRTLSRCPGLSKFFSRTGRAQTSFPQKRGRPAKAIRPPTAFVTSFLVGAPPSRTLFRSATAEGVVGTHVFSRASTSTCFVPFLPSRPLASRSGTPKVRNYDPAASARKPGARIAPESASDTASSPRLADNRIRRLLAHGGRSKPSFSREENGREPSAHVAVTGVHARFAMQPNNETRTVPVMSSPRRNLRRLSARLPPKESRPEAFRSASLDAPLAGGSLRGCHRPAPPPLIWSGGRLTITQ